MSVIASSAENLTIDQLIYTSCKINTIYKIEYNFSKYVYIGQTIDLHKRIFAHISKIKELNKYIHRRWKNKDFNVIDNSSTSSAFKVTDGFPTSMVHEAIKYEKRRTRNFKDLSICKVEIIELFSCDCDSHMGTPCEKARIIETKHILNYPKVFNQRSSI